MYVGNILCQRWSRLNGFRACLMGGTRFDSVEGECWGVFGDGRAKIVGGVSAEARWTHRWRIVVMGPPATPSPRITYVNICSALA